MAIDYEVLEVGLAGGSAILALIPAVLTGMAWKKTGSNRMLFASMAFVAFTLRAILLIFAALNGWREQTHEWLEFGGDLLIIILFNLAFFAPATKPLTLDEMIEE